VSPLLPRRGTHFSPNVEFVFPPQVERVAFPPISPGEIPRGEEGGRF